MRIKVSNARYYDPNIKEFIDRDFYIEDGLLKESFDNKETFIEFDASDLITLPGLFDLHTHALPYIASIGMECDVVGVNNGSAIICDAGSCGSNDFNEFLKYSENSISDTYSFINYSSIGLSKNGKELSKLEYLDDYALEEVILKHKDKIKGIKLRASKSVTGDLDMVPLIKGKEFAKKMGLAVMVHVGNYPPRLEDVLAILDKGDIVTHCFHGKDGGILDSDGKVKDIVRRKYDEGILFDVGHGAASFSFDVATKAIKEGIIPYTISSDIHLRNYHSKVFDLCDVMNKMLVCGMDEKDIFDSVTIHPREIVLRSCTYEVNKPIELSFIRKIDKSKILCDADGNCKEITSYYKNEMIIMKDKIIGVKISD